MGAILGGDGAIVPVDIAIRDVKLLDGSGSAAVEGAQIGRVRLGRTARGFDRSFERKWRDNP